MRREIHEKIKYKKGFYCPAPFMHTTANVSKNSIKMCCEGRYTRSQLSEKSSGIPANKRLNTLDSYITFPLRTICVIISYRFLILNTDGG